MISSQKEKSETRSKKMTHFAIHKLSFYNLLACAAWQQTNFRWSRSSVQMAGKYNIIMNEKNSVCYLVNPFWREIEESIPTGLTSDFVSIPGLVSTFVVRDQDHFHLQCQFRHIQCFCYQTDFLINKIFSEKSQTFPNTHTHMCMYIHAWANKNCRIL